MPFQLCNSGFQRLTYLISTIGTSSAASDLQALLATTSEVLRLLAGVALPLRTPAVTLPTLASEVQDAFIQEIRDRIESLMTAYTNPALEAPQFHRLVGVTLILARLIQFNLGFPGVWTSVLREYCSSLFASLVRINIVRLSLLERNTFRSSHVHSQLQATKIQFNPHPTMFPILLDTATFLLSGV